VQESLNQQQTEQEEMRQLSLANLNQETQNVREEKERVTREKDERIAELLAKTEELQAQLEETAAHGESVLSQELRKVRESHAANQETSRLK
jgi:hypothetical protein